MNKKLMLTIIYAAIIIKFYTIFTQVPINNCEAFDAIRAATIMNIEKLKQKAAQGDIESALALIDLSEKFSESYQTTARSPILMQLKMVDSSGYLHDNIKKAFSEQTYAECKHIFEPASDITNNEETLYNDRED